MFKQQTTDSVDHEGRHYSICGSTCVNLSRTDFKHPLKITGFKHTEQSDVSEEKTRMFGMKLLTQVFNFINKS